MHKKLVAIAQARAVRGINRRSPYSQAIKNVPANLLPHWRETAHLEFEGIPQSARFFAHALEGLMMFFDCSSRAGHQCALPSRAADSVWHAWISMDKESLDSFCTKQFGRPIPHVEARDMQSKMGLALATCLVEGRKLESMSPAAPGLPRLFTLDTLVQMPHGFGYKIFAGLVAFRTLDAVGQARGEPSFPDDLTPYGLFNAGLISEAEHEAGKRLTGACRDRWIATSGASCGSVSPNAGACDGRRANDGSGITGGDSASDSAGSGDGSSCGGGCGGD